jgi:hypothetical protein
MTREVRTLRIRDQLCTVGVIVVAAVTGLAATTVMASPASAAPGLSAGTPAAISPSTRVNTPEARAQLERVMRGATTKTPNTRLTLHGTASTQTSRKQTTQPAVATITCNIYSNGPASGSLPGVGQVIGFVIDVQCDAEILALEVLMGIGANGVLLPESPVECLSTFPPVFGLTTPCLSVAHCVGAGATYEGAAQIVAVTLDGGYHEADILTTARFIPCII